MSTGVELRVGVNAGHHQQGEDEFRYNDGRAHKKHGVRSWLIRLSGIALCGLLWGGLILAIIVLAHGVHTRKAIPDADTIGVIALVEENLKTSLVQDVYVGRNGYCRAGHEIVELTRWPGTKAGSLYHGVVRAETCKDLAKNKTFLETLKNGTEERADYSNVHKKRHGDNGVVQVSKRMLAGNTTTTTTNTTTTPVVQTNHTQTTTTTVVHANGTNTTVVNTTHTNVTVHDQNQHAEANTTTTHNEHHSDSEDPTVFHKEECVDIHAQPPRTLRYWDENALCIVRYNHSEDLHHTNASGCEDGWTLCRQGLCVRSHLNCPVTEIQLTETSRVSPVSDLKISRRGNRNPLLDIAVDLFDEESRCLSKGFYSNETDLNLYPLLVFSQRGCGRYGLDNNTVHADTENEADFYDDNNLTDAVHHLPHYSDFIHNNDVKLVNRLRLEVNESIHVCRHNSSRSFNSAVEGVVSFGAMIGAIVAAIIVTLITFGCTGHNQVQKEDGKYRLKEDSGFYQFGYRLNWATWVGATLIVALWGIAYAVGAHSVKELNETNDYFRELDANNCYVDSRIDRALADFDRVPIFANALVKDVKTGFIVAVSLYAVYIIGQIAKRKRENQHQ